MAFIENQFESLFLQDTFPKLISIYEATGLYTQMPRTMHSHENNVECILITDGYGIHRIDGQRYYTEKGDLLVINSKTVHDESSAANIHLSILSCAMTNLHLQGLAENQLIQPGECPVLKTGAQYETFRSLLTLIADSVLQKGYRFEEYSNYLLRAFVISVRGLIAKSSPEELPQENELAQAIREAIDAHYSEEISLQQLAETLHVSTYHLAHTFKRIYGYAPMQYVTRRRIGEAQTLLIDTATPITQIAMQVGYNSTAYFDKSFRKITGLSPKDYRKAYRKI